MFSRTVSSKSTTSWNTSENAESSVSGSTVETSTPPTKTVPELTSQKREASLTAVLLPEPDAPTSAVTCPSCALNGSLASRLCGAWHSLQASLACVDSLCVTAASCMMWQLAQNGRWSVETMAKAITASSAAPAARPPRKTLSQGPVRGVPIKSLLR